MGTLNISPQLMRALRTNAYFRNGMLPSAPAQTALAQQANFILRHRHKSIEFGTPFGSVPSPGGADRTRFRGVLHTSSHCKALRVHFLGLPAEHVSSTPTFGVEFTNSSGTVLARATSVVGALAPGSAPADSPDATFETQARALDAPGYLAEHEVTPNADYYVRVFDDDGRLVSCSIYEETLEPGNWEENLFGYGSSVQAGTPVFDSDRATMVPALRTAWKRNAAGLLAWSSYTDGSSPSTTSSTATNILDGSAGPVSSSQPGFRLSLANRSTVRRVTVPCKLFVFASHTAGTGTSGNVIMRDSANNLIATLTGFSAAGQWKDTTINLPATDDAFYFQFSTNAVAGTMRVYAVVLAQYEA